MGQWTMKRELLIGPSRALSSNSKACPLIAPLGSEWRGALARFVCRPVCAAICGGGVKLECVPRVALSSGGYPN